MSEDLAQTHPLFRYATVVQSQFRKLAWDESSHFDAKDREAIRTALEAAAAFRQRGDAESQQSFVVRRDAR